MNDTIWDNVTFRTESTITVLSDLNSTTQPSLDLTSQTNFNMTIAETINNLAKKQNKKSPLVSDDIKRILEIVFQIVLFIVTSLFGIAANIVNITVYRKQGIRDSITLGFFALSISDLFVVSLPLIVSGCYIAKFVYPESRINFIGIHYVASAWLRQMAYSFSCILTAFLSLERCCCVILPFKVKLIFTRKRTLITIVAILAFHIFCTIPIFASHQLRWMPDPRRNNTETLRVWLASNREEIEAFNYAVMSIITPTVSQIVLICCAAIMIHGLRSSSKFRRIATSLHTPAANDKHGKDDTAVLSSRDTRLVKAMVFLVGILSTCNLPYLALMYAMLLEPELDLGRAYHNTYSVIFSIYFVMATLNASVNVFVYYNTSSRYKQIFKETFTCRRNSTV